MVSNQQLKNNNKKKKNKKHKYSKLQSHNLKLNSNNRVSSIATLTPRWSKQIEEAETSQTTINDSSYSEARLPLKQNAPKLLFRQDITKTKNLVPHTSLESSHVEMVHDILTPL